MPEHADTTTTADNDAQRPPAGSTAPDGTDTPSSGQNAGDGESERRSSTDESTGGNAEAARYRVRLREVEAERDQLREQLDHRDRAQVERMIAEAAPAPGRARLADPADLWVGGVDLAELRDDDGQLDPELVAEATARVLEAQHGWADRQPAPDLGQGRGRGEAVTDSVSWQEALSGRR